MEYVLETNGLTKRFGSVTALDGIDLKVRFVVAVAIGVYAVPLVFASPVAELSALAAALVVSQLVYRRMLTSHYRTADLA